MKSSVRELGMILQLTIVGVLAIGTPSPGRSAELKAARLNIRSPRPLNDALTQIEQDLHIPINFEEISIEAPDLLVRGEEIGLTHGVLFPRTRTLSVNFVEHESDAYSATNTVVAAYRGANLPGLYETLQNDGQVDVLPMVRITSAGTNASFIPLFKRLITLDRTECTFSEAVEAIAREMSKGSGSEVLVLTQPIRMEDKIRIWANGEAALTVLKRLDGGRNGTSFRLLYDPGDKKYT